MKTQNNSHYSPRLDFGRPLSTIAGRESKVQVVNISYTTGNKKLTAHLWRLRAASQLGRPRGSSGQQCGVSGGSTCVHNQHIWPVPPTEPPERTFASTKKPSVQFFSDIRDGLLCQPPLKDCRSCCGGYRVFGTQCRTLPIRKTKVVRRCSSRDHHGNHGPA